MIIFGTKAKFETISQGMFYCPHCQAQRSYSLKRGKKYFSLYFIPIIPMGDLGEFVECDACGITYAPAVLTRKVSKPQPDAVRLLNNIKRQLDNGIALEYVVRDLTGEGLDRDVADNLVNTVAGEDRRRCPECDLTYVASITQCQECGTMLINA
jgi:hypothetical protein